MLLDVLYKSGVSVVLSILLIQTFLAFSIWVVH